MFTLIYLGTGAAIPGPGRDNTSLALDEGSQVTLVDASGSPLKRLADAGIAHDRLVRVIITHQHLDHTYGFPSLLQGLWLAGRRQPLAVYALPETWIFLDRLVDAYRPSGWTDGLPIERHAIEMGDPPFLETQTMSVRGARAQHSVPTVGLRVELASGASITYSSDTAPADSIIGLAQGTDLLVHEATYLAGREEEAGRYGHSSARQAAEVAVAAEAKRLALVHFTPAEAGDLERLREGAAALFAGPIDVPSDFDRMTFG